MVMLSNGQAYYGSLKEVAPQHIVLERVFYVQSSVNPQTNQPLNQLMDRARSDWHAPTRISIPMDKTVLMGVVGPDSELAKLVSEAAR